MILPPIRLFVASLSLLLAAGPAVAQSDGNVMRERVVRGKDKPATQHRNSTGKQAVAKQGGTEKDKSARAPSDPDKKPPGSPDKAAALAPIVFYVAKGDSDACGPGCREWIAAEGRIDPGAGARFRAFLNRVGARKLPIYFNSPGGSVGDAIEIGRLMRQRAMTAAIGWTIPQECGPARASDRTCNTLKRSGRELVAELNTGRAQCNSACVYALLGAAERKVAAGARLGVHASKITMQVRTSRRLSDAERARAQGMLGQVARERLQSAYERLGRYIADMGIDMRLLQAAQQVRHDQIRFLTRQELALFGIDQRPFVENDWVMDERPAAAPAVLKVMYESVPKNWGPAYRMMFVRLACGGADHVEVAYGQEHRAGLISFPRPIKVSARGGDFSFSTNAYRTRGSNEKLQVEVRRARVPVSFFDAAAGGDAIEVAESSDQRDAEIVPGTTRLSTSGLARSLRVLTERCAAVLAQPAGVSASVPGPLP